MLAPLLLAVPTLRMLFVGNSLLNYNDVPKTVARMLESDGTGRQVTYKAHFVGHLEDVPAGSAIDRDVTGGGYDVVVLQAAMVSSSMTRTYRQTRAIAMATGAKAKKSRVLLYVEWPRRGINETEYTMNVYRGIAKASGAEILPVAYAWNALNKRMPNAALWTGDGNHAVPNGSYLAAACVYYALAGTKSEPSFRPSGVDAAMAKAALAVARETVAKG
ncbi:hypothetical protein EON82_13840 [bacterium]|nr:MAG: hypothetical protein EON82_13840 [bacterium]